MIHYRFSQTERGLSRTVRADSVPYRNTLPWLYQRRNSTADRLVRRGQISICNFPQSPRRTTTSIKNIFYVIGKIHSIFS